MIADPWSTNVKWENSAGSQSSDYSEAHTLFSVGAEQFNWTDQNFEIHEMKDVILYELHMFQNIMDEKLVLKNFNTLFFDKFFR